jgi:hypothetical protein
MAIVVPYIRGESLGNGCKERLLGGERGIEKGKKDGNTEFTEGRTQRSQRAQRTQRRVRRKKGLTQREQSGRPDRVGVNAGNGEEVEE